MKKLLDNNECGSLFSSPRIDLSSHTYGELYFGSLLEQYAPIIPEAVRIAKQKAAIDAYKPDADGEKLTGYIMEHVYPEEDTALLVLIGNNHTPYVLNALQNSHNLRYYSPFSDGSEFWRKIDVEVLLKEQKYSETNFTHAAKHNILDKIIADSPNKPYTVVIGDIHDFPNHAINFLDGAEKLKRKVRRMDVALEGFFKYKHYDVDDIGDQFPLGSYSTFLPQLRNYLESVRTEGIEVRIVPLEHRIPINQKERSFSF